MNLGQKVEEGIFRVRIPIEGSPLKEVNTYLIVSSKKILIVDPGPNHPLCLEILCLVLKESKLDDKEKEVFVTHFHLDHIGLCAKLDGMVLRFFLNEIEAQIIEEKLDERQKEALKLMKQHGFPENELEALKIYHPAKALPPFLPSFHPVKEGYKLLSGETELIVIETPGHSPGHCCLYEPNKRILFSGDHLLKEITPNVSLWSEEVDVLNLYLTNLKRLTELEVKIVLPGHGDPFSEFEKRIGELERHHAERCNEILNLVKNRPLTAYEIASLMRWDVKEKWDDLPTFQKWLGVSEVLAHLIYLERQKKIKRMRRKDYYLWTA